MLSALEIMTELNRVLVIRFPQVKTIYLDTCPAQFERPSFFIECTGSVQTAATYGTYFNADTFEINAFPTVDTFGCAGDEQLLCIRRDLLELLCLGYLQVSDRAVEVSEVKAGGNTDYAFVSFKAEYFEERPAMVDTTTKIEAIKTNLSVV